MADTIDVTCTDCDKTLKVPAQFAGKRVKCRGCGQALPVPAAAAKPPAEVSGAKPSAPPVASKEQARVTWDDEEDNDSKPVGVIHEDDNPRCPHCAGLLEPPDAIICIHCGFNNRTRVKAETKKVYEPEPGEWFSHLAPGVIAFIAIVLMLVLDVASIVNMRHWMEDSILESDEKGFDDRKKMMIQPGFFIMLILFASLGVIYPCIRFGYRRLFVNYLPEEVAMK